VTEQKKSLLTVSCDVPVSEKLHQRLMQHLNPIADSIGCAVLVLDKGLSASVQHDLAPLIDAITDQTKAIQALANSNTALIRAMADEPEQDQEPMTYMDGRPIG
jgi:hypothetical protein